jgi:broad specificity phosphatase PhoE
MCESTVVCTLRHGLTEYAFQKRYAGTIDVPLSEAGANDVKRAARKLVGMHFDAIITSTLKRSIQTARLLFGENVKLVQCAICDERNYGKMQGLTENDVSLLVPKVEFIKKGNDYHSLNPPGGETFDQLRERAEKLYHLVFAEFGGKTVLVISHGVFLQQFHGYIRGLDWKESLCTCPGYLELTLFKFQKNRLIGETSLSFAEEEQVKW